MPVLHSKKVADEYPWTQAALDDPQAFPQYPQMMPKVPPKIPLKNLLFKVWELCPLLLLPSSYPAIQLLCPLGPFQLPTQSAVLQLPSPSSPFILFGSSIIPSPPVPLPSSSPPLQLPSSSAICPIQFTYPTAS